MALLGNYSRVLAGSEVIKLYFSYKVELHQGNWVSDSTLSMR